MVLGQTLKAPLWKTISGDATLSASGALTLTHSYFTQRTITGTAPISVANGDGVSGNPTISLNAPSAFSVHKNGSDQTGIADVTSTLLTWSTEIYDIGSHFASNLWTPPAGKIFLCGALLATGTLSSPAVGTLIFQKNGSDFKSVTTIQAASAMACAGSIEDVASGSDTYGMAINMDLTASTGTVSGGASSTYFMGHWISA